MLVRIFWATIGVLSGIVQGVLQGVSHCLYGFLVIGWFSRIVRVVGSFVFLRGLWAVFGARYLVFLGFLGILEVFVR